MKIVAWATGLAVVWCLKSYYRRAGAEDLGWILAPTCRLAGWLGGISFEWETRTGWVSHEHRMIVGPACAGLNFLIIAFSAFYFTLVQRLDRSPARFLWLPACLAVAFAVTIPANALRIVAATRLHGMDLHGWVTPQGAHRAAGAVIFCAALVVSYVTLEWILRRPPGAGTVLAPIGCYLLIVLGVPLLNGEWRDDPALFLEHAAVVAAACAAACGAWIVLRRQVVS